MSIYSLIKDKVTAIWKSFEELKSWFCKYECSSISMRNDYVVAKKLPSIKEQLGSLVLPNNYLEEQQLIEEQQNQFELFITLSDNNINIIASKPYGNIKITEDEYLIHSTSVFFIIDETTLKTKFYSH